MGISHIGLGPLSQGCALLAELAPVEFQAALRLLSAAGVTAGGIGFLFFARAVFRHSSPWAKAIAWTVSLGFLAALVGSAEAFVRFAPKHDPMLALRLLMLVVPWAWMAFESIRFAAMYRRRVAVGLGSPVVANRFVLWSMASISSLVSLGSYGAGAVASGGGNVGGVFLVAGSASALVGTGLLWLAFMPPESYVQWVRSRSPRPAGAASTP